MSAPELLYGARVEENWQPQNRFTGGGDTIALTDVEIHYALFELPMNALLPRLPSALHPSVPAVLATSFWRVATSPYGPFEFAYTGVACRTGIKPRHFVFGAWCDNADAAAMLGGRYGLECREAVLGLRESYDRIHGTVAVGGHDVLTIVTTNMVSLGGAGAMVKYSPTLGLADVAGAPKLIQFEAAYEFRRVLRGEVTAEVFDAETVGEPELRPAYAIAGTYAVCDVHLLPPRFAVDPVVPAEAGGATKIAG